MLMELKELFCVCYPWGVLCFIGHYLHLDPDFLNEKGAWQTLVVATAIYPIIFIICFSRVIKRRLRFV